MSSDPPEHGSLVPSRFHPRLGLALSVLRVGFGIAPVSADDKADQMSYLDNGLIKIGVALDRSGSIGYLADSKKGTNVVNIHDLGRWIGQSYYSGPKPFGEPHADWKDWPWNPVSAGDVYGNVGKLLEHRNDGKALYVKATPMQWALKKVPADCTFETWITLDGRTVQVRHRLTNLREDQKQYPPMDQELPAVYTIGKLHRLFTYDGEQPFTKAPFREVPKQPAKDGKPQWTTFQATEHWAALVDDDDWGLGIFHPGVYRFLGGYWGKANTGGPQDDPTGYLAPVRKEILDHHLVYEYRYTLILDDLANIRRYAFEHRPSSSLPDYRFKEERQHWWFVNAGRRLPAVEGGKRRPADDRARGILGRQGHAEAVHSCGLPHQTNGGGTLLDYQRTTELQLGTTGAVHYPAGRQVRHLRSRRGRCSVLSREDNGAAVRSGRCRQQG